jgi:hypothetical protein
VPHRADDGRRGHLEAAILGRRSDGPMRRPPPRQKRPPRTTPR